MAHHQTNKTYDICEEEDGVEPPFCPHGPTILFSHSGADGEVLEKFYACASCRSRKECNFYQLSSSKQSEDKKKIRKQIYKDYNTNNQCYKYCTQESSPLLFCKECGVFVPNELCSDTSHPYHYKQLSTEDFKYPSQWITAKESNKTNAQYFFSSEVVEFLGSLISTHNVDRVLCIGAPTVHEYIKQTPTLPSVDSLLLDIDVRLRQFHVDFAHYNMFNHHFYDCTEKKKFEEFVQDSKHLMIMVDPPYGGLIAALRLTLNKINTAVKAKVTTLMFFPYFMEAQMSKNLPSLVMSDYKVNYSNHSGYKEGRPRGSPARLYTDIPMNALVLPAAEGYRYCEKCERYVSKENLHCDRCDTCTTKDGPTYQHCDICQRCTKPGRIHCHICAKCQLVEHNCVKDSSSLLIGDSTLTSKQKMTLPGQSRKNKVHTTAKVQWQPKKKKMKHK